MNFIQVFVVLILSIIVTSNYGLAVNNDDREVPSTRTLSEVGDQTRESSRKLSTFTDSLNVLDNRTNRKGCARAKTKTAATGTCACEPGSTPESINGPNIGRDGITAGECCEECSDLGYNYNQYNPETSSCACTTDGNCVGHSDPNVNCCSFSVGK